jgi:hypothetical protein
MKTKIKKLIRLFKSQRLAAKIVIILLSSFTIFAAYCLTLTFVNIITMLWNLF